MAIYAKRGTTVPEVQLAQLHAPLQRYEQENALGYALWHVFDRAAMADTMWTTEIDTLRSRQKRSGKTNAAVRDLAEMLDQLGFEINLPDSVSEENSGKTTERTPEQERSYAQLGEKMRFSARLDPYHLTANGRNYQLFVWPVSARLNLNLIKEEPLVRYLEVSGLGTEKANELAMFILDWRDKDSLSRVLEGETPISYANTLNEIPNEKIDSWEELIFMQGSSVDLINFLQSHFVLRGDMNRVHSAFLTVKELAALTDLPETKARAVLDFFRRPPPKSSNEKEIFLEDVVGNATADIVNRFVENDIKRDAPVIVRLIQEGASEGIEVVVIRDNNERVLDRRVFSSSSGDVGARQDR